ncbi:MAG: hypothetical protein R2827_16645 [Bdellovibrionales bacterium]
MFRRALFLLLILVAPGWAHAVDSLGKIPVQDLGRIKPFESFARESLQLLYGKQTYKLHQKTSDGDEITVGREADEVIFTMMFLPEVWAEQNIIVIDNRSLKQALQVDPEQKYFNFSALITNPRVGLLVRELEGRVSRKEQLDGFSRAVQNLNNQLTLMNAIMAQRAVQVVPPPEGSESDRWLSVAELNDEDKEAFTNIFMTVAKNTPKEPGKKFSKEGNQEVLKSVMAFVEHVKAKHGEYYPSGEIKAELWLHGFQPFLWAWVLYLIGAFLLLFAWMGENKKILFIGLGNFYCCSLCFTRWVFWFASTS